jgi:monoamine oxidase
VSDDVMELAIQPQRELPLHLAGEAFSRSQSWVEGALETAEKVIERLLESPGAGHVAGT